MRAMALLATVVASGVVAGQVLGGVLVDLDLLGAAWRPVFLINVPVGLDVVSVLLLADVITLVMVPLTFGHQVGWVWWTWACLAAAIPTAAALVAHLRRAGAPLVDLGLLRRGPFPVGLLAIVAMMVAVRAGLRRGEPRRAGAVGARGTTPSRCRC